MSEQLDGLEELLFRRLGNKYGPGSCELVGDEEWAWLKRWLDSEPDPFSPPDMKEPKPSCLLERAEELFLLLIAHGFPDVDEQTTIDAAARTFHLEGFKDEERTDEENMATARVFLKNMIELGRDKLRNPDAFL